MSDFEIGSDVWLLGGQKCQLEGELGSRFVVRYYVERVYGDEYEQSPGDEVHIVDQIFDQPPRAVIDKTISELHGKVESYRNSLRDLRGLVARLERENATKVKELRGRSDQLTMLLGVLDRKYEWVVVNQYGQHKICSFDEFFVDKEYARNKLRAVTIILEEGEIKVSRNQYSDGGGGDTYFYAFETKEEAIAFLKPHLDEKVGYSIRNNSNCERLINSYTENGLEAPKELVDHFKARQKKDREAEIERVKAHLAKLEATS